MDYGKILTRSFEVAFKNRALWVFGILLALFGEGGRSGGSFNFPSGSGGSGSGSRDTGLPGTLPDLGLPPSLAPDVQNAIGLIVVSVCCVILVWAILSIVLRFISRGALIGSVQELEANGTSPTVKNGFSIGASRLRSMLGIALLINVPLALVSILLVLLAFAPLLVTIIPMIASGRGDVGNQVTAYLVSGAFGTLALLCCVGVLLTLVSFVLHPLYQFFVRECVVQKRGALDSIREGYHLVRANLGSVAVLYLLSIGISIGYTLLMIPVVLITIGIPLVAGVLVYFMASQSTLPAIVAGIIVGIPMLAILLFVGGLYLTFDSTLWTEGYLAVSQKPATPVAVIEQPASA